MTRSKLIFFVKHTVCASTVLLAILWLSVLRKSEGADLSWHRSQLEIKQPDTVIIGNSVCKAAVDEILLTNLTGASILKVTSNGSASAWWYLYVRNVVCASKYRPKKIVIFFRDHYLTDPTFRVHGKYRKPLRRISNGDETLVWQRAYGGRPETFWDWAPAEAKERFERRLLKMGTELTGHNKHDAEAAMAEAFDEELMIPELITAQQLASEQAEGVDAYAFEHGLSKSLLSATLDLLDEAGVEAIFVRCKRRRDVDDNAEPAALRQYILDLQNYLSTRQAKLIDFTGESAITIDHFGPGDHLNEPGKTLFTHTFAEEIKAYL